MDNKPEETKPKPRPQDMWIGIGCLSIIIIGIISIFVAIGMHNYKVAVADKPDNSTTYRIKSDCGGTAAYMTDQGVKTRHYDSPGMVNIQPEGLAKYSVVAIPDVTGCMAEVWIERGGQKWNYDLTYGGSGPAKAEYVFQ